MRWKKTSLVFIILAYLTFKIIHIEGAFASPNGEVGSPNFSNEAMVLLLERLRVRDAEIEMEPNLKRKIDIYEERRKGVMSAHVILKSKFDNRKCIEEMNHRNFIETYVLEWTNAVDSSDSANEKICVNVNVFETSEKQCLNRDYAIKNIRKFDMLAKTLPATCN